VVFDTYFNGNEPATPYMAIAANGDLSTLLANTGTTRPFSNGATWFCWVDYNGATHAFEVRLAPSSTRPVLPTLQTTLNLLTIIGQSTAYLGFGAGTGDFYFVPTISAFSYAVTSIPDRKEIPLFLILVLLV